MDEESVKDWASAFAVLEMWIGSPQDYSTEQQEIDVVNFR